MSGLTFQTVKVWYGIRDKMYYCTMRFHACWRCNSILNWWRHNQVTPRSLLLEKLCVYRLQRNPMETYITFAPMAARQGDTCVKSYLILVVIQTGWLIRRMSQHAYISVTHWWEITPSCVNHICHRVSLCIYLLSPLSHLLPCTDQWRGYIWSTRSYFNT